MNIFGLGPTELLIIAAIILLLFGPKRLPQIGKALGQTAKSVRDGLEGKIEDDAPAAPAKIEAAKPEPVAAAVADAVEPPYEVAETVDHDKAE